MRVLFGLHPVIGIEPENGIQPLFDNAGDFVYWGSGAPAYTAYSRLGSPPPDSLRAATGGYAPPARYFLQLPDRLDPRIQALADSLTAGLDNDYDKAVAIQRYLGTFRYTLELPATSREATLPWFLFERKAGHCEYFSTAMVVLLRAAGVESRNVNGFLGGEWSQFGNYLAVTQNQAHSWVEVWFPGYGWVTFDPTPAGAGGGEHLESWFWPGRILFDAIQHRWNKWVLDYSAQSQVGILERWTTLFAAEPGDTGERSDPSGPDFTFWGAGGFALLLLAGFWWARSSRGSLPRETRMYLGLREACERAGILVTPGLTPLVLVERLRRSRPGAARPAERVVELYLRARYGGRELGESELREMSAALGAARRTLRTSAGAP